MVKPYRTGAYLSLLAMALTAATQPLLGEAIELLLDKGFKHKVDFNLWLIPAVLVSVFQTKKPTREGRLFRFLAEASKAPARSACGIRRVAPTRATAARGTWANP